MQHAARPCKKQEEDRHGDLSRKSRSHKVFCKAMTRDTMPCNDPAGVTQLVECQPSKRNSKSVSIATNSASNGTSHSVSSSNQDGLDIGLIVESWSRLSPHVQAKILDVVKKAIT